MGGATHSPKSLVCVEQEVGDFRKAMETNYMSSVHLIKAAAPAMVVRREVSFSLLSVSLSLVCLSLSLVRLSLSSYPCCVVLPPSLLSTPLPLYSTASLPLCIFASQPLSAFVHQCYASMR